MLSFAIGASITTSSVSHGGAISSPFAHLAELPFLPASDFFLNQSVASFHSSVRVSFVSHLPSSDTVNIESTCSETLANAALLWARAYRQITSALFGIFPPLSHAASRRFL